MDRVMSPGIVNQSDALAYLKLPSLGRYRQLSRVVLLTLNRETTLDNPAVLVGISTFSILLLVARLGCYNQLHKCQR